MTPRDVMECLAHNLDPATGKELRPHAKDGDRVGMDFTFNAPKSVTLAREMAGEANTGDPRIETAHREAVSYAMQHIEADMQTRVKGGREPDRATGNLCAYRVTHRDTRTNPGDQMPDPHLHDHCFVMNLTFDTVEERFKAAQVAEIKHDAPYYEAVYMNRLASNLRDLGYGIRREGKAFEIAGIDRPLIEKFSRRTKYIEGVAAKLGITNPESKAKLGATTRLGKAKELADDLNGYYVSRLTNQEREKLAHLEFEPCYVSDEQKAVRYAIDHLFERSSVVEERKLYETALRHGIGSVTVEGVQEEAIRQGGLLKDDQVTTKAVLGEESRIIDFAREGKGTMRPLSSAVQYTTDLPKHPAIAPAFGQQKGRPDESKRPLRTEFTGDTATHFPDQQAVSDIGKAISLSPEQAAVVNHILTSPDQVVLIRGAAGTGKTHTMQTTLAAVNCPVAVLAPTVTASRGVLHDDGFKDADTVASFLRSKQWQESIRNGMIYVDEAPLTPIKNLSALCEIAKQQNARLVLQGDPKQHHSVLRNGNMFKVLQEYAGLPVAELTDIRRQSGRFKQAVAAIEAGDFLKGHDIITELKWVKPEERLVDDYLDALATKRHNQTDRQRAIIIAPTHAAGDAITAELRRKMKDAGKLGEDVGLKQYAPLHWSEAERGDIHRYAGTETLVFGRNSGTFKNGQIVRIADFKPGDHWSSGMHFTVYEERTLPVAVGDTIRTTANVKDVNGKRVDNGTHLKVTAITDKGIEAGGRVLPLGVGHLTHGYVATSIGGQGKTVDKVFASMGSESLPALKARQFYVDLSRARFDAGIYTNLPPAELRKAIQRKDERMSATELMNPKKKPKPRRRKFLERMKDAYVQLRDRVASVIREPKQQEREHTIGR